MQNDSGLLLIFCIQDQALAEKNFGGVKTAACSPSASPVTYKELCSPRNPNYKSKLHNAFSVNGHPLKNYFPDARWIRKLAVISINSPWREHLLSSGYRYKTQYYPVHKELKLQRSSCFMNVKLRVVCASWSYLNQPMVRISLNFHITEEIMPLNCCCKLSYSLYSPLSRLEWETRSEAWSSTSHPNLGHQTPWFLLSLSVKQIFISK